MLLHMFVLGSPPFAVIVFASRLLDSFINLLQVPLRWRSTLSAFLGFLVRRGQQSLHASTNSISIVLSKRYNLKLDIYTGFTKQRWSVSELHRPISVTMYEITSAGIHAYYEPYHNAHKHLMASVLRRAGANKVPIFA